VPGATAPATTSVPTPPTPPAAPSATKDPRVLVGGKVWVDVDGNGVQSPDEFGIATVIVRIYDGKSNFVTEVTTNQDGRWTAQLLPGNYELDVVLPQGFSPTTKKRVAFVVVEGETITAPVGLQPPTANELAFTGSETGSATQTGVALIGAGAVLIAASRRRRFTLRRR
jgi:SdrD B-like domain